MLSLHRRHNLKGRKHAIFYAAFYEMRLIQFFRARDKKLLHETKTFVVSPAFSIYWYLYYTNLTCVTECPSQYIRLSRAKSNSDNFVDWVLIKRTTKAKKHEFGEKRGIWTV